MALDKVNNTGNVNSGAKKNNPVVKHKETQNSSIFEGKKKSKSKETGELTEKEKMWIKEMKENGVNDPDWAAGAGVCFLLSRAYHWLTGD